jgi:hypothetical protein
MLTGLKKFLRSWREWKWGCVVPLLILFALDVAALALGGMQAFIKSAMWAAVVFLISLGCYVASFAIGREETTYNRNTRQVISTESWNEGVELTREFLQPIVEETKSHGLGGLLRILAIYLISVVVGYLLLMLGILGCMGAYRIYQVLAS